MKYILSLLIPFNIYCQSFINGGFSGPSDYDIRFQDFANRAPKPELIFNSPFKRDTDFFSWNKLNTINIDYDGARFTMDINGHTYSKFIFNIDKIEFDLNFDKTSQLKSFSFNGISTSFTRFYLDTSGPFSSTISFESLVKDNGKIDIKIQAVPENEGGIAIFGVICLILALSRSFIKK